MNRPGDDYVCRCYEQKLPIHAKIIKKENENLIEEEMVEKKVYFLHAVSKKEYFL